MERLFGVDVALSGGDGGAQSVLRHAPSAAEFNGFDDIALRRGRFRRDFRGLELGLAGLLGSWRRSRSGLGNGFERIGFFRFLRRLLLALLRFGLLGRLGLFRRLLRVWRL